MKSVISKIIFIITMALLISMTVQAAQFVDEIRAMVPKIQVAVDLNRNGIISFSELDNNGQLSVSGDTTSPSVPFRFWLNDDYDVVALEGKIIIDKDCTGRSPELCEQMDEANTLSSSSYYGKANSDDIVIDNLRDLEDFAPIAIRLSPWDKNYPNIKVKIKARGFGINLFEGKWGDIADEYVSDKVVATEQVSASFITKVEDTIGVQDPSLVKELPRSAFNDSGIAKLVFEGISGSNICRTLPEECYLEVTLEDTNGAVIDRSRVYMDLQPIENFYDHYTVGTGYAKLPNPESALEPLRTEHAATLTIENNPADQYILFVHGWRMQYWERLRFAETAFKRLYWLGYKGKYGFFSWPTDWFKKPGYYTEFESLIAVLDDQQNYSRSEAIARRAGRTGLKDLLQTLRQNYPLNNSSSLNVFAHSMGNVVVSEALRASNDGIVDSYVASQAAESSGAYQQSADDMTVKMPGGDFVTYISKKPNLFEFLIAIYTDQCVGKELLFEQAWRCVNLNTLDPWDIPPDQYRWGDIPQPHDLAPTTTNPWGNQYYATINTKVSSINNFYNPEDAALNAWRFQQITKPDSGIGTDPAWSYDPVEDSNTPGNYFDRYFRRITVDIVDGVPITDTVELHWADEDTDPGRQEILGHIIPSRTEPLGQTAASNGTSVIGNSEQFSFGKSNYGHSAQFLTDNMTRRTYWQQLLDVFGLNSRR